MAGHHNMWVVSTSIETLGSLMAIKVRDRITDAPRDTHHRRDEDQNRRDDNNNRRGWDEGRHMSLAGRLFRKRSRAATDGRSNDNSSRGRHDDRGKVRDRDSGCRHLCDKLPLLNHHRINESVVQRQLDGSMLRAPGSRLKARSPSPLTSRRGSSKVSLGRGHLPGRLASIFF